MNLNRWLEINNQELIDITRQIVGDEDCMDLYQNVIEQLLKKPTKIEELPDDQKKFFFIRIIKNNYFSTTSPYHYQIRKGNDKKTLLEDHHYIHIEDTPYTEDIPDMDWVRIQLRTLDWFSRDLFLLWIELETITKVSQQTQIPLNSVSRYIKKIKKILKERWEYERGLDL